MTNQHTHNSFCNNSEASTFLKIEKVTTMMFHSTHRDTPYSMGESINFFNMSKATLSDSLQQICSVFQPHYQYSNHVEAFKHGCQTTGLFDLVSKGGFAFNVRDFITDELMNDLIESSAQFYVDHNPDMYYTDEVLQDEFNKVRLRAHTSEKFMECTHTLVVSMDFGFIEHAQQFTTIDNVVSYYYTLLKEQANILNVEFQSLVGIAWVMEQSAERGYHIRASYLFDGSVCQNDEWIAAQLGALWMSITNGVGIFYTKNTQESKANDDLLGIRCVGMIHDEDDEVVSNTLNSIATLAKPAPQEYLRAKPIGCNTSFIGFSKRHTYLN